MADTLSIIRASMETMRDSEKKVAKCIISDPNSVIGYSITELAEKAKTSEPTVIRFCRKLGLTGYMELRLNLARDLPSSEYLFENVGEKDSLVEITGKILNAHREAIGTTMNKINLDVLEEAVSALVAAKKIEFYGVGGSAIVADDAHHKFFRLGVQCIAYGDPHMQAMSAALLGPEDMVVAISHTGSTKDIIESVNIARNAGARVIGILGREKSPLVRICDFVLPVYSQEVAIRLAPMASRIAQIALLDVLFVAVALRKIDTVRGLLEKAKRSLVDKRD